MLLFNSGKKLEKAFTEEQFAALVEALKQHESNAASREDLRETELRLQLEIEKVRSELKTDIEKIRADLTTEIEKIRTEAAATKFSLLKWQLGIGLALACIMAKGFGWLGF